MEGSPWFRGPPYGTVGPKPPHSAAFTNYFSFAKLTSALMLLAVCELGPAANETCITTWARKPEGRSAPNSVDVLPFPFLLFSPEPRAKLFIGLKRTVLVSCNEMPSRAATKHGFTIPFGQILYIQHGRTTISTLMPPGHLLCDGSPTQEGLCFASTLERRERGVPPYQCLDRCIA
jgi:hypothetical protein